MRKKEINHKSKKEGKSNKIENNNCFDDSHSVSSFYRPNKQQSLFFEIIHNNYNLKGCHRFPFLKLILSWVHKIIFYNI